MKIKHKTILFAVPLSLLLLSGCSTTSDNTVNNTGTTAITPEQVSVEYDYTKEETAFDWKSQSYQTIDLTSGSATISKSGIYLLTGDLKDGSLTVNVDKTTDNGTVYLILNSVSLHSESSTPLNIIEAENVILFLEEGTTSEISQGSLTTTDESFPSAALFSKADLTVTGKGILNVSTDYNDGITSRDDLIITGGTIYVEAVNDGLVGKDLLMIEKAQINITAGKDALRSTNADEADKGNIVIGDNAAFYIQCEDDAMHAENSILINGGEIDINKCTEGIEGNNITITDGTIHIVSSDDGINVTDQNGLLSISGGNISIESGGDSIDSNGSFTHTGGDIVIDTSKTGQMDTPIDCDGTYSSTGGTITDQNGNTITFQPGKQGGGRMGGKRI